MKLWGGRFAKNSDRRMDDFHSSIRFDRRLYREDIEGSLAHVAKLGKTGVIWMRMASTISGNGHLK